MKAQLHITDIDFQRLLTLVNHFGADKKADPVNLEVLREELLKADKIDPEKIPADYITMNSEFEVTDVTTGRVMRFRLVYPQLADFRSGKLSVLSPLGSALIGYREGDEVEFLAPGGKRMVRIGRILYQPEANGEYEL